MLRALGKIVLIVGSTVLCATAYDHRRTAHYMFGIPVTDDDVNLISNIHPHSPHADLIRHASLIIWDELQMMNKAGWECMDNICHIICCRPHSPFGGIPFIGLGDFQQIGPVISGAGQTATLQASIKSSLLWKRMTVFTLTTPIHSFGDPEFTQFVDRIREDTSGNHQRLQMLAKTSSINRAVGVLFPQALLMDLDACLERVFLSPQNMFVDEFNDKILEKLPGEYSKWHLVYKTTVSELPSASYFSSDSVVEAEQSPLRGPEETPEYLALLSHPGVPPHRLDLKVDCICAIQHNLSVEKGLVRNARVRITALHQWFVEVQILNTFEMHCIPCITFPFNPGKSSWMVHRKQFPL